jgi:hypothetical protein
LVCRSHRGRDGDCDGLCSVFVLVTDPFFAPCSVKCALSKNSSGYHSRSVKIVIFKTVVLYCYSEFLPLSGHDTMACDATIHYRPVAAISRGQPNVGQHLLE